MSIGAAIRAGVATVRLRFARWARWIDKALSHPPLDEADARRRAEANTVFQPRDS